MRKTVTIAIPAFNEQARIVKTITSLLDQNQTGWKLHKIYIYDDGSTDKTTQIVNDFQNNHVMLISDDKRLGKTARLQQMINNLTTDILCIIDADLEINDTTFITQLIAPLKEENVVLVGGNVLPAQPKTFIQSCVYATFQVFYQSRINLKGGNNIFGCGGILAMKRSFANQITFPDIVNEDAFLYLSCISRGMQFRYVDAAKGYYTLPRTLLDYLRQAFRSHPEAVSVELCPYFGKLVETELQRPLLFYVKTVGYQLLKTPIQVLFMVLLHLIIKPFYGLAIRRYRLEWFTAKSTHE